jgi:putative transport protein
LPAFSLGSLGCNIDEPFWNSSETLVFCYFVYTVGPQVGPGFLSSVTHRGLQLNAFGAAVVLLGGLIVAGFRFLFHFSAPVIGGLFAGATTNTPSLATKDPKTRTGAANSPASNGRGSGAIAIPRIANVEIIRSAMEDTAITRQVVGGDR